MSSSSQIDAGAATPTTREDRDLQRSDYDSIQISHEEVSGDTGVFVVEPLERGFGHTFGNSLRRVLLSSLEGAAVTSVQIEGAVHEFTTLAGVREDLTDVILNLRQLVCVLHGDAEQLEVRLSGEGGKSGSVVNSCAVPSILTEVTAAPSSEESSTRRSELPKV